MINIKPYPINNINYTPITPKYIKNNLANSESRYSVYRIIDNNPDAKQSLEIRINSAISGNTTFNGYYYTTTENENLYSIAKKYYNNEKYYWVLAKTNGIKDDGLSVISRNTTIIVPNLIELQKENGYFSQNT